MAIPKFISNFFNKTDEVKLIAQKYNISFEYGLVVDGLYVSDFNYLAQSYSRYKLIDIADLLKMSKESRLVIVAIITEEMSKDSSNHDYREKVTNAKENFDNFAKIVNTLNSYADEIQTE